MAMHEQVINEVMKNPHGYGGGLGMGVFISMGWKWIAGKHKEFMNRITKLEIDNAKLSDEIKNLNENKVTKLAQDFATLQSNQKTQEVSMNELFKKLDEMQMEGVKRTEKLTEKMDKMEHNIEKSLDFGQIISEGLKDVLAKIKKR